MRWLAVGLTACVLTGAAGASDGTGQRTLGRTIPYSVGRALPDRAGEWVRAAQIQMFNPGDLWEFIDGAAEQYLSYGFQDLATSRYTSDQTRTVVVAEVYRMAEPRGAFGIYRQEVNPKARPVGLGVEGRASSNTIRFWLAEFYAMEGMTEDALEWVRLAVRIGNDNYPLVARSPKLDGLRQDPRFLELLEELRQRWEERRRAEEAA
jgi:hypothetical protein